MCGVAPDTLNKDKVIWKVSHIRVMHLCCALGAWSLEWHSPVCCSLCAILDVCVFCLLVG